MNNAPTHITDKMEQMIAKRVYRSIHFSPHLPELIPIESFLYAMKGYAKRSQFNGVDGFFF
jgi:hypothetical protein